ncbi:DUF1553 domain-containing protein [Tundrisphaera lichenicola]|uniref:DUF1553 domain-containing protein n=1 Tax=Tundrisphaera lichenicola TaxID=2029860 RepID=UPI003EBD7FDB
MTARLIGGVLFLIPLTSFASDSPSAAAIERFEKKIRPLLATHCWKCHGPEKSKGGLRLDSAEAIHRGGDTGPGLVPNKPEESLLIQAILYEDDLLKMPPKGKLDESDLKELVDWVKTGAIWPEDGSTQPVDLTVKPDRPDPIQAGRSFWAFQAIKDPPPPNVENGGWAKSPIDRFILSGLEANHLEPAPPAEKRDLIRRATFDLTGIPPTPQEIEQFLEDEAPNAFERVIDRLLASPRYGERWGRHWLDLARYADSNGMDENMAYANAYRYRDYVVRSFNSDKPYDRFVEEQIAGDLLTQNEADTSDRDPLIATGFLVIGPKMLAEDDPVKMEMDIIDEQVDTVGRVFLGLTFGCARCHDHKFDPIPTVDYYGLAGIFKSTKSMQNHKVVAMWNERPVGSKAEELAVEAHKAAESRLHEELRSAVSRARAALTIDHRARLADYLEAGWRWHRSRKIRKSLSVSGVAGEKTDGSLFREAESFDRGNVLVESTNYGHEIGVILNRGELPNRVDYDFDVPADAVYQFEIRHAAAEARPVRLMLDGLEIASEVAGAVTGSWGPEKQSWSVAGMARIGAGRHTVRLERDGVFPHIDKLALVPITLPEGVSPSSLIALQELADDRSLNPRLIERWSDFLSKAQDDTGSIFHGWNPGEPTLGSRALEASQLFDEAGVAEFDRVLKDPILADYRRILDDPTGPFSVPRKAEALFSPTTAKRLERDRERLAQLKAKAPSLGMAMSVEDQEPSDLRIHIRGSHLTLGDPAPRHFPQVLASKSDPLIDPAHSGRLEFARWMTRKGHPLTSRVMANRIWLGHFGEGLVRTPDNFGNLGERPDHPELLDWLASRFVESGWSIKALHRQIMLSSTYQMSTLHNPEAAEIDPENRLLWHVSRRRLEAEAIRDALLAVGDDLDETMGGSLLATNNHAYVNDTSAGGELRYGVNRRSIYLPVIRSGLYDVFQAFDFADPSTSNGKRIPTTVAPQALFMMNDPLVLRSTTAMAGRLLKQAELDDQGRIQTAYLKAFGRRPTETETDRALGYLKRFEEILIEQGVESDARPLRIWQTLCQALLSSSEFLYLD